jgi:hypothetical protein
MSDTIYIYIKHKSKQIKIAEFIALAAMLAHSVVAYRRGGLLERSKKYQILLSRNKVK